MITESDRGGGIMGILWRLALTLVAASLILCVPRSAEAADCYESTIVAPSPFKGNNDEIFRLADGSIWQVKYEYEYLYEYRPDVVICPSRGILVINGKSLNVVAIQQPRTRTAPVTRAAPSNALTVVYRQRGCDYFIADGPQGYYLLEWYGGHDPAVGDILVGYDRGYGFKDVTYLKGGSSGRIWADDFLLSKNKVIEKLSEKCN